MTKAIQSVNAFVVKFANVNGSGSASANELFAKAILRMGVPVSPRNIFPSNIQGLPTWYEVRVSESGWLGRRGGVDLMVAMNPQTWDADVKEIDPGGYLFYDDTKALPKSKFRDDINVIGMPLTEICNQAYSDARQRQLFKNIIYVGALSALLDVDPGEIAELIGEQYKGKEALLKPNLHALQLGRTHALEHLKCPLGIRVRRLKGEANKVGEKIFIEGNAAAALGCVYGGATVCAWYPITPSSSLAEAFQKYCSKLRVDKDTGKNKFAIVQGEDELASIGIAVGAGWNGARAFTATSGPGISLMQEFIGLAYFAEIPVTIIDVQRGGPSTGMPTRTQQSDVLKCAYASHGDTKHVLLFPEDPHECFEFAALALDLADRLQTPVFLHPVPHLSRHAPFEGRLLHPRHEQERVRDLLGAGRGLQGQHAAPPEEVRDRQDAGPEAGPRAFEGAGALRRDLLRLDQPRHGGGARRALAPGHLRERGARQIVPVPGRDLRLRRLALQGLRDRAEPRRAAEDAARQRRRHQPGEPHFGAALRRHADHRALHHRRDRRDRRGAQRAPARQEGQGQSGMIHRLDAGIYSLSPFGERARVRG